MITLRQVVVKQNPEGAANYLVQVSEAPTAEHEARAAHALVPRRPAKPPPPGRVLRC